VNNLQGLLHDWSRTNYAGECTAEIAGSDVTVMGWVHEIRDFGGIMFVILRDVTGRVQITAPSKKVEAEVLEQLRELRKESVVAIKGLAQEAPKAPNGVEILPKEVKVLNMANQPLPMDPTERSKLVSIPDWIQDFWTSERKTFQQSSKSKARCSIQSGISSMTMDFMKSTLPNS
jgi:aspartyl/asparaginyl-tRNA synthetase